MRGWTKPVPLLWRELVWPQPLTSDETVAGFRALADEPTSPLVVVELRAQAGRIRYLLGVERGQADIVSRLLGASVSATAIPLDMQTKRPPVTTAREVTLSAQERMLDTTNPVDVARSILQALCRADQPGEELVMQIILGNRIRAHMPNTRPEVAFSWPEFKFIERPLDATMKTARNQKTALPGFHCTVRMGVSATSSARRQQLALGVLGGLKRLEVPGVRLDYKPLHPDLGEATSVAIPRWRPLRLNVAEVAALCALPVGDKTLPGLPSAHPKTLPVNSDGRSRVDAGHALVALSDARATLDWPLTRSTDTLLHHLHILGPTGTGKSVSLLNLALQDMQAGRSVVVIEPKGDLVEDILARLPESREQDVVVFDPLNDAGIVGLNPLAGSDSHMGSSELRADALFMIFRDLFGDSLGVRTSDILHAGLLTLARQPDASLIQLPLLLTNPELRRRLTRSVLDDLALAPFWTWYENLKDGERMSVIAPLMNKLRALLLNPVIRRVIGQTKPRFHVEQVFSEHRILLAALPVDRLGEQGAGLLGSLLAARVWHAAQQRAHLPKEARLPAAVYIDEAQKFLHLGTDLSDVLATSRSYGVGWTLAHQYLSQLGTELKTALLANCRSRIAFQPSREDGETLAKGSGGQLVTEDFTSLSAFHAYVSLFAHGRTQPYVSGRTLPAPEASNDSRRLRQQSADTYGRSADEIEAEFRRWQGIQAMDTNGKYAEAEPVGMRKRGSHA